MKENKHPYDVDYVVIGSGFGGSVSALRLAQKGYTVRVIEQGRRWKPADFPKSNWNIKKSLWAPLLGCHGIQAFTLLKDIFVLHGTGVGGGSLVYANTLLTPNKAIFEQPSWPTGFNKTTDWFKRLIPHYRTARKMLGATAVQDPPDLNNNAFGGPAEQVLHQVAQELGKENTFHRPEVGVFFGEPKSSTLDPYFDGQGPNRTGCTHCGSCMTGCRDGGKNTLDKNYLYLAEKLGVTIVPDTKVIDIIPISSSDTAQNEHGYTVHTKPVDSFLFSSFFYNALLRRKKSTTITCRGVVVAGGALGSVRLLLAAKHSGSLPSLSSKLGCFVRTNSEALVAVNAPKNSTIDYSKGVAIAAGFFPDNETHIETVRYGAGHDAMALLATIGVGGGPPWPRWCRWIASSIRHPLKFTRHLLPFGWAKRTIILLCMQSKPNHLSLELKRPWYNPFKLVLSSNNIDNQAVPSYFPVANEVAHLAANKMNGQTSNLLPEVLLGLSSTAHILGGCIMADGIENGVVDEKGEVFNYPHLYVVDGSIVPANLSVNPSLTITALAEWVCSQIKNRADS